MNEANFNVDNGSEANAASMQKLMASATVTEIKYDEQGNPIVPVESETAEAVVQTDADINP